MWNRILVWLGIRESEKMKELNKIYEYQTNLRQKRSEMQLEEMIKNDTLATKRINRPVAGKIADKKSSQKTETKRDDYHSTRVIADPFAGNLSGTELYTRPVQNYEEMITSTLTPPEPPSTPSVPSEPSNPSYESSSSSESSYNSSDSSSSWSSDSTSGGDFGGGGSGGDY